MKHPPGFLSELPLALKESGERRVPPSSERSFFWHILFDLSPPSGVSLFLSRVRKVPRTCGLGPVSCSSVSPSGFHPLSLFPAFFFSPSEVLSQPKESRSLGNLAPLSSFLVKALQEAYGLASCSPPFSPFLSEEAGRSSSWVRILFLFSCSGPSSSGGTCETFWLRCLMRLFFLPFSRALPFLLKRSFFGAPTNFSLSCWSLQRALWSFASFCCSLFCFFPSEEAVWQHAFPFFDVFASRVLSFLSTPPSSNIERVVSPTDLSRAVSLLTRACPETSLPLLGPSLAIELAVRRKPRPWTIAAFFGSRSILWFFFGCFLPFDAVGLYRRSLSPFLYC